MWIQTLCSAGADNKNSSLVLRSLSSHWWSQILETETWTISLLRSVKLQHFNSCSTAIKPALWGTKPNHRLLISSASVCQNTWILLGWIQFTCNLLSILQYMCNSNYLTKVIVFIKYYVVARSLRKLDVLRKIIFYNNSKNLIIYYHL